MPDLHKFLDEEDYIEQECLLCMDKAQKSKPLRTIPIGRVIEKLDDYFSRNDYLGAERHLLYWLEDAKDGKDLRGMLILSNELMGIYRKTGKKEAAYKKADEAINLLKELEMEESDVAGTTYLNAATVLKAFGEAEKSLTLYKKAQIIYEKENKSADQNLGGLYNNMALALTDIGDYSAAERYYYKAINIMMSIKEGPLDAAISYLNLADLAAKRDGLEKAEHEINSLLDKAEELINDNSLTKNGYYAFVCEKCAPTFLYYGRFLFANELKIRAGSIYERD